MTSPPSPVDPSWVHVIIAILGGGGVKYVFDIYKEWRAGKGDLPEEHKLYDHNLLTVTKARDELEADNARLREELSECRAEGRQVRVDFLAERTRYEEERARWRAEVAMLEQQIRGEREAAQVRYDALLEQVQALRVRHENGEPT